MTVLYHVLLFVHFLCWAIVLGSTLAGLKESKLYAGAFHAALTALVAGVLAVLVHEVWLDTARKLDPAWVATKLIVAAAIVALTWFGHRKPDHVGKALLVTILSLTVLNVGVAAIWH